MHVRLVLLLLRAARGGGARGRAPRRRRRAAAHATRQRRAACAVDARGERDRQQHRRTQAQPLLDKCVEDTKSETGCLYYGWTVKEDGSKLFCRETYVDGAAAGEHLSCVAASGALGEALEKGYIALDNIDVMGTEADLEAAKKVPEFEAFGCGAWTVWDSFQNFKKTSSEEAATQGFYTIQPTFTLKDKAAAEPFMKKCVDLTKNEEGCMYYGWTIKDDKLFCREAYVDAAAVQAHLDNIVPAVGEMLDSGCASLDEINFMGPKAGWSTFKETADSLAASTGTSTRPSRNSRCPPSSSAPSPSR